MIDDGGNWRDSIYLFLWGGIISKVAKPAEVLNIVDYKKNNGFKKVFLFRMSRQQAQVLYIILYISFINTNGNSVIC